MTLASGGWVDLGSSEEHLHWHFGGGCPNAQHLDPGRPSSSIAQAQTPAVRSCTAGKTLTLPFGFGCGDVAPKNTHIIIIYIYINGYWNSEINRSRLRSSWIQHGSKDGPVTSQSGSTNWGMTAYCNLIPTYTSTTAETHGFEAPRLACRHQLSYAEDRTPGQWGVHARCIPKAGAPGSGQTSVCSILCHQWIQLWFNYVLTIYIYIYQL